MGRPTSYNAEIVPRESIKTVPRYAPNFGELEFSFGRISATYDSTVFASLASSPRQFFLVSGLFITV